MQRIDAHAHWAGDTPAAIDLMRELDIKTLNIGTGRAPGMDPGQETSRYQELVRDHPDLFAWCTGIEEPDFGDPAGYQERTIANISQDRAHGAIAVKITKLFGMSYRKPDGSYLMPDDPLLEPVMRYLEKEEIPLLSHIGEYGDAFRPLNPASPFYEYLKKNPQFHFHARQDGTPGRDELMRARDHITARHPRLVHVGAHYGCLEDDLEGLARRLDQYPHFFVDSSGMARAEYLGLQPPRVVTDFFVKYQDRIMFGTDRGTPGRLSTCDTDEQSRILDEYRDHVESGIAFYAEDREVEMRGTRAHGLGLSDEIIRKFVRDNARRIYRSI